MSQLFRTKSIDELIAASEDPQKSSQNAGSLESHGPRHRRRDRQRYFHSHRYGRRRQTIAIKSMLTRTVIDLMLNGISCGVAIGTSRRRTGDHGLIRAGGHRVRFRGAVLRGTGVDDSHCRQRLHVCIRHPGRDCRVDNRVGPDSGICRLEMSVAVGFSAYLQDLFDNLFGFHLPPSARFSAVSGAGRSGGVVQYSGAADHACW